MIHHKIADKEYKQVLKILYFFSEQDNVIVKNIGVKYLLYRASASRQRVNRVKELYLIIH